MKNLTDLKEAKVLKRAEQQVIKGGLKSLKCNSHNDCDAGMCCVPFQNYNFGVCTFSSGPDCLS